MQSLSYTTFSRLLKTHLFVFVCLFCNVLYNVLCIAATRVTCELAPDKCALILTNELSHTAGKVEKLVQDPDLNQSQILCSEAYPSPCLSMCVC